MPSSGISTERSPVKRKPAWTFWYILTFIISVSHILIVMKLLYLQKYMLKKKPVVGPLRITFVFTFFWWAKHFRFAMEMLSDTVCAVPSSLTHRYCLLFLFLCQTLLFIFVELYLLSNLASSAVPLFCPHFVHYSFAWQTCYKESLEGLAEDGGTQWLHYSSGDKAQRQGNENLFTLHKSYISS